MTLQLIGLIALLVLGATGISWSLVAARPRASVLSRIADYNVAPTAVLLPDASGWTRFGAWLSRMVPGWAVTEGQRRQLNQAGFSSEAAPAWYGATRILAFVIVPAATFLLLQDARPLLFAIGMTMGIAIGVLAPVGWLDRQVASRQDRIRKALPDALDLMLVSVEAGVSLDAAILRVGRELLLVHPDLASELLMLNRRRNAGMSRDDALRGLYERTGVEELRILATNIAQSERWGTSMSRVLRVDSEVLRRKRREHAERRAALASTKMVFPLALLILPALLAVVYGPAIINIRQVFNAAN